MLLPSGGSEVTLPANPYWAQILELNWLNAVSVGVVAVHEAGTSEALRKVGSGAIPASNALMRVAADLNRQFQPPRSKVAHLEHAISINLMLNTKRPGETLGQYGVVYVARCQRPCVSLTCRSQIDGRQPAVGKEWEPAPVSVRAEVRTPCRAACSNCMPMSGPSRFVSEAEA